MKVNIELSKDELVEFNKLSGIKKDIDAQINNLVQSITDRSKSENKELLNKGFPPFILPNGEIPYRFNNGVLSIELAEPREVLPEKEKEVQHG